MAPPLLLCIPGNEGAAMMSSNEVNLRGTVISLSESGDHYDVRVYCRVQIVQVRLPKEARKPELGEDVVLSGNLKVSGWVPNRDADKNIIEN